MGFSLWSLFKAGLLLVNSVMILNRRRFLAKHGLDDMNSDRAINGGALRAQAIGLLQAVQYLKVPVIICNIVTIVFELVLGGA